MNEHDLVAAAVQGDRTALGQLIDHYHPPLYRYVYYRVDRDSDRAQDVLADVWERVTRAIERYEDRGRPFSAWLYRIAYTRLLDHVRSHRRHASFTCPLEDTVVSVDLPDRDTVMDVQHGLSCLTPLQRRVLGCRYNQDLPLELTAAQLGITTGAAKAVQHRAIGALRRYFEQIAQGERL